MRCYSAFKWTLKNYWQRHENKIARLALNPVHMIDKNVTFYGATFSLIYLGEKS